MNKNTSGGGDFVAFMLILALILILLVFFLLVWGTCFVIRTLVKYHYRKALWIALLVYGVCCLVGGLLCYLVNAAWGLLPLIGVASLVVTCFVVDLQERETLLPERVNLAEQMLHSPWWADTSTPASQKLLTA